MADAIWDTKDEAIIELLKEDARRPFVEIAKRVGLSEAAVRRRVQALVKRGVIRRFTVEVERGQNVDALTFVSVHPSVPTTSVSQAVKAVKGVTLVYEIAGEYDIAAMVSGSTMAEVNRSVDEIRNVDGVRTTNTVVILRAVH